MICNLLYGVEGAKQAEGLIVIIDIFRSATLEAYLLGNGASYIFPVATIEEALAIKKEHLDYVLVGENNGIKIEGFDYGNSPTEIAEVDFTNKIVVHRSSEGTQGLVNASSANNLIFGQLRNFFSDSALYTKGKTFCFVPCGNGKRRKRR